MSQPKIARSIVNKIIRKLQIADRNTDAAKILLAKELHEAYIIINWGHTAYGSYWNMLNTEVLLANSTCEHYRYFYKQILHFGFTGQQITRCLRDLGWSRFTRAAIYQKRKISCTQFIAKYKGIPLISLSYSRKGKKTDDRTYVFSLPSDIADKFDGILKAHGMSIGPAGGRTNVMVAVMGLLDTL